MVRTSDVSDGQSEIGELLAHRFRCDGVGSLTLSGELPPGEGFFRFGQDAICYGECAGGTLAAHADGMLWDAKSAVKLRDSRVELPFDPRQIIDNLRCERYPLAKTAGKLLKPAGPIRNLYYGVRPLLGVSTRRYFQKFYFRGWDKIPFPRWPVDRTVEALFEMLLVMAMKARNLERVPFIWFWPDGLPTCTMMTHDVETSAGLNFCRELMDLNDSFGIKSSFHIIPEKRYTVDEATLETIRRRGFEIDVHDLNHDGLLMCNRDEFRRRAKRINSYGKQFGAEGFRSAVMYRNVEWYGDLDFSYDMSIPNAAHLDPQQGGCCTVFPFFVGDILELPLTTTQDYSLYNILSDHSIDLWKTQVAVLRENHGLMSFIIHPDYNIETKCRRVYADLLGYLAELEASGETWVALPREVAKWWRLRSNLKIEDAGGMLRIEGNGSERARLAYAVLENGVLRYEVDRDVKVSVSAR